MERGATAGGSAAIPMEAGLAAAAQACRETFDGVVSLFDSARDGRPLSIDTAEHAVDGLLASLDEDRDALISLVRLKSHDDYACMHSVAVSALMACLAQQMKQGEAGRRQAAMAGLLHDIGKAFVSPCVLQKPDKLTDTEFKQVQAHPQCGYEALGATAGVEAAVRDVALHHHERPDGKGYPHRLAGNQLTLLARMGAVCDVYDAITSNRPYKDGWDPGLAMERMLEWGHAGQFDTVVVGAFRAIMGPYPIGSLVRLRSGRLAVVNAQRSGKPTQPSVTAFYCTRANAVLPPEIVDLGLPRAGDSIERTESNAVWRFTDLDKLWAGSFSTGLQQVKCDVPAFPEWRC